MIIDTHCHLGFSALDHAAAQQVCAGRPLEEFEFEQRGRFADSRTATAHDDGPRPTAFASYISPRALRRLAFRTSRWMFGIDPNLPAGPAVDLPLAEVYRQHLERSALVDRFVLLAFDAYHHEDGTRPPLPASSRALGSDIYTSNSLAREFCRAWPQRYLFGASVHPYRPDALAALDEVWQAGACLLKWLPLHQNIDVRDERTIAVLRRCAELGLPVLVHYNAEFALTSQHAELIPIGPLLRVLHRLRIEGAMPTIIVAHVATPVTAFGSWGPYDDLIGALLGEFADAPLFADISALTTFGKAGFVRRIAARQELHSKLLFGTDFPVPLGLMRFCRELGTEYARVRALKSWPDQAVEVFRRAGFNEIVMHQAARWLPHVDFFATRP